MFSSHKNVNRMIRNTGVVFMRGGERTHLPKRRLTDILITSGIPAGWDCASPNKQELSSGDFPFLFYVVFTRVKEKTGFENRIERICAVKWKQGNKTKKDCPGEGQPSIMMQKLERHRAGARFGSKTTMAAIPETNRVRNLRVLRSRKIFRILARSFLIFLRSLWV